MENFDLAILGAGPGGYVAAIKAAELGLGVVLFEKEFIGGVCLNVGCIPTKAMMKSAHLIEEMRHAETYGINSGSESGPSVNWESMMSRKDGVVSKLTGGVEKLLKMAGVKIVKAFATVTDSTHVEADGEVYEVKNIILALGSSPSYPDIKGMDEALKTGKVLDSTGLLSLKEQPKSLLVIGGGVVALEFATMFNAFGTEVTMVQRSDMILSGMDDEVRKQMGRQAKKSGINLLTGTAIKEINGTTLTYEQKGKTKEAKADYVLVSLGRSANTKGVEALNLEMNKGRVLVDEYYRTSVKGVYAIGDMSSKLKLAHVATAEGLAALDHIIGKPRTIDYNKIPSGIYGFPEAAAIGMTEQEVADLGIEYEVAKFPVAANGRSMAAGESVGFVKIISDKKLGEVLGVHIVAGIATDLISEALMVMQLEGTVKDIGLAVHAHPTNSEMMQETAHIIEGFPIHVNK